MYTEIKSSRNHGNKKDTFAVSLLPNADTSLLRVTLNINSMTL
jgi:hypothetical protein